MEDLFSQSADFYYQSTELQIKFVCDITNDSSDTSSESISIVVRYDGRDLEVIGEGAILDLNHDSSSSNDVLNTIIVDGIDLATGRFK